MKYNNAETKYQKPPTFKISAIIHSLERACTPSRNAVPLSRQSSAKIFVSCKASCMLLPAAIIAQTMAPAEEPANGVVSCAKKIY